MADKSQMCLLGLVLSALLTGTGGARDTHVFCSSGENVSLPCNNALFGCTSTAWMYSKQSGTVELIYGGKKKKDIERSERLSLGSDCSLNITKVTKEDHGSYICRQFVTGKQGKNEQQGNDSRVYLHFLHVTSSSSQISPGSSVTLSCQLYCDLISCDSLVRDEVQLIWVNQFGVNLQTDSRYQISFSSEHCNISLTTKLQNEDLNREWRCEVTQRNQPKTSVTYTVKYSAAVDSTKPLPVKNKPRQTTRPAAVDSTKPIPVSSSEKKPRQTKPAAQDAADSACKTYTLFRVIVIIVEIAVFVAPTVVLLQISCVKRAGRKISRHPEEIEMPTVLQ
ncbi:uncharacterized protein LOC122343071 isoform X1 [Puntigrus tetrazona]|uniref:uncharacterized protein LOC122343071 isoform X1 n=1 Tax=Puntigrus tetrazona TaxID=1606681 RepID=UPI001C8AA965|nr:uncharacterized protein LOC122343071 isoform X1 [Puntigrus tetrazona]